MAHPELLRTPTDRYLYTIDQYQSPASRIEGYHQILEFNLKAPAPMLVLGHEAFVHWQACGGITPPIEEAIRGAYRDIRKLNTTPERGAYIGRAFHIPGIENPNGPRTAAIFNENEYVGEVERFYHFVVDHGYSKVPGADIALIFHPFIHVMDKRQTYGAKKLEECLEVNEILPWTGGYIVPDPAPGRKFQVRIAATYGPDEAVQSSPHDEYVVDPETETVYEKTISLKTHSFVPHTGSMYKPYPIPPSMQLEQALTDKEVLAVAREAQKVLSKKSNVRMEFIAQEDGVYFREIAPWKPVNKRDLLKLAIGEKVIAPVVAVSSTRDVQRITGPEAIVYFSPEAFQERQTDLFVQVAYLPSIYKMVALVHGSITTSHMARILSDAGHSVILVGDEEYADGSVYQVSKSASGDPVVESLNPYEKAVIPFSDVQHLQKGVAGMKVARLSLMRHFGIPVPDGFAITSQGILQYLKDIGLHKNISVLNALSPDNSHGIERHTGIIREKILESPLPDELAAEIKKTTKSYGFSRWAIRSSGSEDGDDTSLAGLYESPTDVETKDLVNLVRRTVASYFSPASITTLGKLGEQPSGMKVGVGFHEFIPVEAHTLGAVVFTYPDKIQIEAVLGSPELVVSGHAKDYIRVSIPRDTAIAVKERIGTPEFDISNKQIKDAVVYIQKIEELFHCFLDIEMLFTLRRGIVIVQARPL